MSIIAWRWLTALLLAAACAQPAGVIRVPASTRGTVACGAARCAVPAEKCVLLEPTGDARAPSWRCLPSGQRLDAEQSQACDDASDCTDGQACCLGFQSASVSYACSPRSGARANCALESCVEAGGAPCPAGQVCRAGACAPADARATCNGGQRCPSSAPICVWAKGVATCTSEAIRVDTDELAANELRMSCASREDCGAGLHCCTNALGDATSCRVNCDAANNLELCDHDADCTAIGAQQLSCGRVSADEPEHFPPWVRTCAAR